ncbi:hypothetical protein L2E82_07095 [Cichorium intybus]|uniref:Uncharacterized protein n=1 Tax=Cichorium intybus TaxID=13427 RepID=A0ACB9G3R3_CICIN|nr:hypothetical protein L2E82_07095 [Cichorium intybus]
MTLQSSRSAHCAHSSRTINFELDGEKIDRNLSPSHEKEKEEDHYLCLNSNGNSIKSFKKRAFSFKLFDEKIDPNLDQSYEKEKEDDHDHRFLNDNGNPLCRSNSMGSLDAFNNEPEFMEHGYLSDGLPNGSSHYIHDKKKGMPWTRDEHKQFLIGLDKLGKGNWRGISREYVKTRTPTQVASHAQKYYIRMKAREKGKRKTSLFDMSNELIGYGNRSTERKSNNPKCSTMAPFGTTSGLNPFYNSWIQRTSQALFASQPLSITHESSRPVVAASTNKEDVS